ncbi:Cell division protein FtsW [Sandaracinus amylolyticus]|uniref:Probable peptidoglycan glycosyltransferase FtsW n=2 Tax=Sandaracinus amylolyticus TaxID=927083 RepID=A0A0F6W4L1_9BACT|nr:Cell division protein FtsW [Sandaracinus amylolyticus]
MGMIRSWIAARFRKSEMPLRVADVPRASVPAPAPSLLGGWPKAIGPSDPVLLGIVLALIAFGVVMTFSASAVFASQRFHDGHFFLVRQAIFAGIALPVMIVVSRIDYHLLRPLTYPILGVTIALLVYVALGFGHSAGGAARWIAIGPFHVQPAEVAKVAMILWLAYSLSKKQEAIRTFKVGILPHLLVMGFLALLCLRQPDFGSAVMICVITFVLLFAAGAKVGPILSMVLAGAGLAVLLVISSPYRMRRVEAFLDPFGHRQDAGYQVAESIIAFGSGGATGVGIGDSRQKLFFLPEAHTDFVSAIIGEELGFVGIALLVLAFVLIVVRGVRVAFRAADDYGSFLAIGVTMFVGLQAFTNLAVAMGMVPTKGLVLPFVSYGGSALLVNAAAMGLLLNVSRPREGDETATSESTQTGNARASAPSGFRTIEGGAA